MAAAMSSESTAALQAVMQALETLHKNPDKAAKDQANTWLQDFQKTVSGRGWDIEQSFCGVRGV